MGRLWETPQAMAGQTRVFDGLSSDIMKKTVSSIPLDELFAQLLAYTNFVTTSDGSYLPVPSVEKLKNDLDSKLDARSRDVTNDDLPGFAFPLAMGPRHPFHSTRQVWNPFQFQT